MKDRFLRLDSPPPRTHRSPLRAPPVNLFHSPTSHDQRSPQLTSEDLRQPDTTNSLVTSLLISLPNLTLNHHG